MNVLAVAVLLSVLHLNQQPDAAQMMQANKPPTSVLGLPPIGTELGIFGAWERGNLAPGKEPALVAKAGDVQITQCNVTRVDDPYGGRGRIQVDVILNKVARDHYVDIYVSGYYVGINGEIEGVKNVGRRPAYEFMRVDYVNQNKHPVKEPNRRYAFQIPDVLPAKVRVELYQISNGKAARFLGKKEAGFDTDWKDYGVIEGALFGDIKSMITKAAFLVEPGTESVNVRVPALKPIKPDDTSNDLNISLRMKGQTEVKETVNRSIGGRQLNWKATQVSSGPSIKDRDTRNNLYWPYLKGGGYLELPPINAGNAPLIKYP